jgi:hypothetical protein
LGRAEDGERAAPDQPAPALPRHSLPDFERLSELGEEIVQAHLLRQLPRKGLAAVADGLAFTIDRMAKIDSAYKKAFPDRG